MNSQEKDEYLYMKLFNNEDFNFDNLMFKEMKFMINSSNIPYNVIGRKLVPDLADESSYLELAGIRDTIESFVKSGKKLYLYSDTCGNGKTTWAIKLMLQYFYEMWPANCYKERGLFVNVPTFLTKLKAVISKPDSKFEDMKVKLTEVDLVIWDDIAATKLSDYDYNNLLTYIDDRTLNGKSNIYTGNIRPENLESSVGQRLASRITGGSTVIRFYGKDKR